VFCTADDLLPRRTKNAGRILTDAEVVTLSVAQAIMGISSDAPFPQGRAEATGAPVPAVAEQTRLPAASRRPAAAGSPTPPTTATASATAATSGGFRLHGLFALDVCVPETRIGLINDPAWSSGPSEWAADRRANGR